MEWEVFVGGPEPILEELTHALASGPTTLIRTADGFVLKDASFAALADSRQVRERATSILQSVSAISRLLLQSTESLSINSVVEVRSDGIRRVRP